MQAQGAPTRTADIGAPTFCRLSDGGHSVTRLPRSDPPDNMSGIQQRAKCTRSDITVSADFPVFFRVLSRARFQMGDHSPIGMQ